MEIIPAIDLRQGQVVRLEKGDDRRRTAYGQDPAAQLCLFKEAGVERVHVVDLDAAFGETPQRPLIAELAGLGVRLELGGGLGSREAVQWALDTGVERVVLGSMVARQPQLFAELAHEHPQKLVPALEVAAGNLRVAGWRERAEAGLDSVVDSLRGLPCPALLVTDVERDGTLVGPNLDLACDLGRRTGLPTLLSGGVRDLADLKQAARCPEIAGAIVGKALYEGRFTVSQAMAAAAGEDSP